MVARDHRQLCPRYPDTGPPQLIALSGDGGLRRPVGHDLATVTQHDHPVDHGKPDRSAMFDHDECGAGELGRRSDCVADLENSCGIEIGRRLVEEE